jgi:hypothetical protein
MMQEVKIKPLKVLKTWLVSLSGVDVSFAVGSWVYGTGAAMKYYTTGIGWHGEKVHMLFNKFSDCDIITYRVVLGWFKLEVKVATCGSIKYSYS